MKLLTKTIGILTFCLISFAPNSFAFSIDDDARYAAVSTVDYACVDFATRVSGNTSERWFERFSYACEYNVGDACIKRAKKLSGNTTGAWMERFGYACAYNDGDACLRFVARRSGARNGVSAELIATGCQGSNVQCVRRKANRRGESNMWRLIEIAESCAR